MSQPSPEVKARYRERHREELRAKGREYAARRRAEDPAYVEKQRERMRRLTQEQPEHMRAIQKRSYDKHAEKRRAAARAYRAANPEKVAAYNAEWYAKNAVHARSTARIWAAEHPEQRRENYRRWCRENPEAKRAHDALRRARKAGAEGSFTGEEWAALCEEYGGRCAYCGCVPAELTVDHVVALSRGGTNWITNIVPACRPCNSRKHDRLVEEFLAELMLL